MYKNVGFGVQRWLICRCCLFEHIYPTRNWCNYLHLSKLQVDQFHWVDCPLEWVCVSLDPRILPGSFGVFCWDKRVNSPRIQLDVSVGAPCPFNCSKLRFGFKTNYNIDSNKNNGVNLENMKSNRKKKQKKTMKFHELLIGWWNTLCWLSVFLKNGVAFYPPIQGQLVTARFSSLVFQILPEVNGVLGMFLGSKWHLLTWKVFGRLAVRATFNLSICGVKFTNKADRREIWSVPGSRWQIALVLIPFLVSIKPPTIGASVFSLLVTWCHFAYLRLKTPLPSHLPHVKTRLFISKSTIISSKFPKFPDVQWSETNFHLPLPTGKNPTDNRWLR